MRKIYIVGVMLLFSVLVLAQEEPQEKKKWVEFSGHVRFEAFSDTYNSVAGRYGDVYLYPSRAIFDANGEDLNKNLQFKMFSGQSRLRAKINGPDAFGAKINGMFEFDLLGMSTISELAPRIRHLFMNANWGETQLLLGYTWHPVFVTECFPAVLSMGAGLPINPLNRSTQAKVTHKLTDNLVLVGGIFSYGEFRSSGNANQQRDAGIPDFHGQFKYVSKTIATGLVGGYRLNKPRLVTDNNIQTDKMVGAFDVAAFVRFNATDDLTLKLYGIFGQDMSPFVMMGGYGASQDPSLVDDYDYTNVETMAAWTEVVYKYDAFKFGLFGGYSKNLGTSDDSFYSSVAFGRGLNIENILRVSPYIAYTSGKVMVGLEYMYTSATYIDIAADEWEIINTDPAVGNSKIQFSTKYSF